MCVLNNDDMDDEWNGPELEKEEVTSVLDEVEMPSEVLIKCRCIHTTTHIA